VLKEPASASPSLSYRWQARHGGGAETEHGDFPDSLPGRVFRLLLGGRLRTFEMTPGAAVDLAPSRPQRPARLLAPNDQAQAPEALPPRRQRRSRTSSAPT
jgi:hypothetical protein